MKNSTIYSFGNSLREKIISGKDERTELCRRFEEMLLRKTGIAVICSDFSYSEYQSTLFIYADVSNSSVLEDEKQCDVISSDRYPKGELSAAILECLDIATESSGLQKINFSESTSINVSDYRETAINIYFNVNIEDIQHEVKRNISKEPFRLAWRHASSNQYYLIFDDNAQKENAEHSGLIGKIIAFVSDYCKKNDSLGIFKDDVLPVVTTMDELRASNMIMGIWRNNQHLL